MSLGLELLGERAYDLRLGVFGVWSCGRQDYLRSLQKGVGCVNATPLGPFSEFSLRAVACDVWFESVPLLSTIVDLAYVRWRFLISETGEFHPPSPARQCDFLLPDGYDYLVWPPVRWAALPQAFQVLDHNDPRLAASA